MCDFRGCTTIDKNVSIVLSVKDTVIGGHFLIRGFFISMTEMTDVCPSRLHLDFYVVESSMR
jgi:hypothetical protein